MTSAQQSLHSNSAHGRSISQRFFDSQNQQAEASKKSNYSIFKLKAQCPTPQVAREVAQRKMALIHQRLLAKQRLRQKIG